MAWSRIRRGAAIPNAQVELTNVGTSVVRTTSTNSDGAYAFPSVVPGVYTMQASATGFSTVTQAQTTLEVSQTATFDFQLKVGTAQQNVTVNAAEGATLETATSELGTVVNTKEVTDLPLNGRNFTQLLTITAGVANINRDQSASGGGGWAGNSLGSFTFPAVNGARNRSNYFVLDGENDLNTMLGMYNYAPIVDAIQEFKTQGHNDLAEYGAAAGGIVSVVTKSGTNQFHGALWEFLRNEDMDARGYFESTLPPLKQNQYGASAGGPVWIPKVYDGKNRTFFYAAFEGFQLRSAVTHRIPCTDGCGAQRRFQRPGRTDLRSGDDHFNPVTGSTRAPRFLAALSPADRINPDLGAFPDAHPAGRPVGEREQRLFLRTSLDQPEFGNGSRRPEFRQQ